MPGHVPEEMSRTKTAGDTRTDSSRCYKGRTNRIVVKNNLSYLDIEPNTLRAKDLELTQTLTTTQERRHSARRGKRGDRGEDLARGRSSEVAGDLRTDGGGGSAG